MIRDTRRASVVIAFYVLTSTSTTVDPRGPKGK